MDQSSLLENSKIVQNFTLKQLKDSIPEKYFQPSIPKSLAYFFLDIVIILGLFYLAIYLDSWYFYPFYWFLQGTYFWALFVVGHDCGHGSFSNSKLLNNFIGHIAHSPILVPYHGWRISHRTHHSNTGNVDKDESWYPLYESDYKKLSWISKFLRYKIFLILFPLYLIVRSPKREGSHFLPGSKLFVASEKWDVLTSTFWWSICFSGLIYSVYQFGFFTVLNFYIIPYFIFVIWLSLVTFLHHTDTTVPWYKDSNWTYVKGALSTIDRKYGLIEPIHHNIGTHIVHHLFSKIPHYNLLEANKYLRKLIGNDYNVIKEPILSSLFKGYKYCHYVPDTGDILNYTSDSLKNKQ